jgi:hypothetical protein
VGGKGQVEGTDFSRAGEVARRKTAIRPIESEEKEMEAGESGGEEARKVKKIQDPKLPTAAEVEEHNLNHLPFRSWCHHCVRGRGREMDHTKVKKGEHELDEFHLDYCFPGDEFGYKLAVLVAVERGTGMKASIVVPRKGSTGNFAARRVVDLVNECGNKDRDIILKTDQEPAILYLVDDISKNRTGAKTIPEEAPKKSSGSNGMVERAVQTVEGQLRTMKSSLDERYMTKISAQHPVVVWMCDYVGYLLNRLEVGRDGKTAYERMKGKKSTVLGIEFGEKVMWKARQTGPFLKKLEARWQFGLFIGIKKTSGEVIVANEDGAVKVARTIRRVPSETRWQVGNLEWVKHVPWNLGREDKEADGDAAEFDFKNGPGAAMTREEVEEVRHQGPSGRQPHTAHIFKTDFEKHGYTDRCPGCSAMLRKMNPQPHSGACRRRMAKVMEGDMRFELAKKRKDEFDIKKEVEKEDKPMKRKVLQDLEDQILAEVNPEKLEKMYKEYARMATEEAPGKKMQRTTPLGKEDDKPMKRKVLQDLEDQILAEVNPEKLEKMYKEYARMATEEGPGKKMQRTIPLGMEDDDEAKKQVAKEVLEPMNTGGSASSGMKRASEVPLEELEKTIGNVMVEMDLKEVEEMNIEQVIGAEGERYAWDDVNKVELPIKLVDEARQEEVKRPGGS